MKNHTKNIDQDDFAPKDLSAALKISRGHLHRKIKALSGHTTTDFIHIIRIQLACNLLQKAHYPSRKAYEIGYKDPCYFTRVFTRLIGQSPTQFSLAAQTSNFIKYVLQYSYRLITIVHL
ncbi:MAG: helix-turn-helix transcriptional regulator [Haliscomenobacter sp.]|nr:helix-turn-helix transcriptional regulator [Haliscomenobacter sp.]